MRQLSQSRRAERHTRLHHIWKRVYQWAKKKYRKTPRLALRIGCPIIDRARRRDIRAFMHTGAHGGGLVCTHHRAATLENEYLVGLFLHEIGHNLAERAWGRSEQEDADKAVRDFLGVKIHYRGPLLLEWVSKAHTRRILSG